jgi:hypothetical protein
VRGRKTSSFPSPLGEKNFSHSSAYAPLRRKTKRALAIVRHSNDKTNDTTEKNSRLQRFAAYARLKNKKSAGDSTTRQRQPQNNKKTTAIRQRHNEDVCAYL